MTTLTALSSPVEHLSSKPAFLEHLSTKTEVQRLNINDLFYDLVLYFNSKFSSNNPVYLQQYFAISEHTITQLIYFLMNETPVKKEVQFYDSRDCLLMTKKNWWLMKENGTTLKLKKVSQDQTDLRYEELTDKGEILHELKSAFNFQGKVKKLEDLGLFGVISYNLERYYVHRGEDYDFYVDVVLLKQNVDLPTYYVIGCVRVKDPSAKFTEDLLESLQVVQPVRSKLLQVVSVANRPLLKKIQEGGFIYREVFADNHLTHFRAHPFSREAQLRDFMLRKEFKSWLKETTESEKLAISKSNDQEVLFNFFLSARARLEAEEEEEAEEKGKEKEEEEEEDDFE